MQAENANNFTPLRSIRKARGLSLAELSKMCGISIGSIGNYETGTRGISPFFLQKIADALQISVEEISKSQYPPHESDGSNQWQVRECDAPSTQDHCAQDIRDLRSELDKLNAKVDTLIQLLSGRLALSGEDKKEKAG